MAGGIVGYIHTNSHIKECLNMGSVIVSNYDYIGGIVGFNFQACSTENCINAGYVYGENCVNVSAIGSGGIGGILGYNRSFNTNAINKCVNTGVIQGASWHCIVYDGVPYPNIQNSN